MLFAAPMLLWLLVGCGGQPKETGVAVVDSLISDIVLELLSYVAHMERELIHSRQAEGIAAAKARGVRFGPRPKERGDAYRDSLALWREGKLSARAAGRRLGVPHTTFLKWAGEDDGDCK